VAFLTVPFFSILSTGQTVALTHMLNGSNDAFPRKEVPVGVRMKGDDIWRKYAPNGGVNRQFQAQMPKFKNCNISVELKPIMTPFCAHTEG